MLGLRFEDGQTVLSIVASVPDLALRFGRSEEGIAAHWAYKEGKTRGKDEQKFAWLRQLMEWQRDVSESDATEFVEGIKLDIFQDQVFVFTPKGDIKDLPAGATPLKIQVAAGHTEYPLDLLVFAQAARASGRPEAIEEALAAASPHLLEPVQRLTVVCPSSASSRVTSAIASRRGQMLGMSPRDGWTGWDRVDALIPEAELGGLEAELRSQSHGLATYEAQFDHLAELNGTLADKIVQQRMPEPA